MDQLENLTLKDLKALAQERGVKGYYKMNKSVLIEELKTRVGDPPVEKDCDDCPVQMNSVSVVLESAVEPETCSYVESPKLSDRLFRDQLVYGDSVNYNGRKYMLFVNNLFCNKCLIRILLTENMDSLLLVVHFSKPEDSAKNSFHVLQQIDGPLYEENIRLGLPNRVAIKEMENGQKLVHNHHRYESFIMDKVRYRIVQKTNSFASDPSIDMCIIVHNQCYEFRCCGLCDNPEVNNIRVFNNVDVPSKIGIFFNDSLKKVSRWVDLARTEDVDKYKGDQYCVTFDFKTNSMDLRE